MIEAFWFGVNMLIGVPIALALILVVREVTRALVALAFGFRVFEIKWGVGRQLGSRSIGPIDFVRGALPVGLSIRAESGRARHHRLGRLAQAAIPLTIQVVLAIGLRASDPASLDGVLAGPSPLASLGLANLLVIGVHAVLAIETRAGDQTDIRRILDVAFGPAEANRHARASYYARYACHWLERGEVDRARSILEQGVTQLAHDPLVVACQARVLDHDLRSVVDQGACSGDLRTLIEDDAPGRRVASRDAKLGERLRRTAISALPVFLAALFSAALGTESIARFAHQRMVAWNSAIADLDRPADCEAALVRWSRWAPVIDWPLASDAALLRDRHAQLARLEACRGRFDEAVAHQAVANEAAEQALSGHAGEDGDVAARRLRDEIHRATLLRRTAEFEAGRRRYRVALATLARAASELEATRKRLTRRSDSRVPADDEPSIENEQVRIQVARNEILARMKLN